MSRTAIEGFNCIRDSFTLPPMVAIVECRW